MYQIRRDIRQRNQNEETLVQSRVGDYKIGAIKNQVVIKQDINVDSSRGIREGTFPPKLLLNSLCLPEESVRGEVGLTRYDRIEEWFLIGVPDRLRLVHRGRLQIEQMYGKQIECRPQVTETVPNIASERDEDTGHQDSLRSKFGRTIASDIFTTRDISNTS